jgi:hypothetical protein
MAAGMHDHDGRADEPRWRRRYMTTTHRIGQSRFQRVRIITQDHSYDQLSQAVQIKKIPQQIAGEGSIELDNADF